MKSFTETQHFKQWWLWLIVTGITALHLYGLYQQFYLGKPFGDNPASDEGLILFSLVPLLLILLFFVLRLDTRIDETGVHYRFFPFHISYRTKQWKDIEKAYVPHYKPLYEYGGWGIRGFGRDRALNVSGNIGLQLQMNNGDKLLIGTQEGEEVKQILLKQNASFQNTSTPEIR